MLQNVYFLAKIGADKAENEPHVAKTFNNVLISIKIANPGVEERCGAAEADHPEVLGGKHARRAWADS